MYGLSKQHVSEARKLCEIVAADSYGEKAAEFAAGERELADAEPQ